MKTIHASAGDGRYAIHIDAFSTEGKGLCAFLYGGEIPHNGGTVVAVPRLKSNAAHDHDFTADIWISAVPHHKDTEIAVPIAKLMAVQLNEPMSLTAGIHIDKASREEINLLCHNCKEAALHFIETYKKETESI